MFETATAAHSARPATAAATSARWQWLVPVLEMAALATGNWPLTRDRSAAGWTCLPRIATRTHAAGVDSLHAARDFTAATLRRWGLPDRSDDVVVVVSELITNALRHAVHCPGPAPSPHPVRLALLQPGPCVLCAVSDPSGQTPVLREPAWYDERGRGLHVVASLSDEWGWTAPSPAGKVVWAMFAIGRNQDFALNRAGAA